jgi:hypothetical protein
MSRRRVPWRRRAWKSAPVLSRGGVRFQRAPGPDRKAATPRAAIAMFYGCREGMDTHATVALFADGPGPARRGHRLPLLRRGKLLRLPVRLRVRLCRGQLRFGLLRRAGSRPAARPAGGANQRPGDASGRRRSRKARGNQGNAQDRRRCQRRHEKQGRRYGPQVRNRLNHRDTKSTDKTPNVNEVPPHVRFPILISPGAFSVLSVALWFNCVFTCWRARACAAWPAPA